jgi:choline dehydrogenase-like flavoprotein
MSDRVDVIVVGSGPSGAMAASRLVRAGLRVRMLDVGLRANPYEGLIPPLPFQDLRQLDSQQCRYLLGDKREGVPLGTKMVGALLTPPRQYVLEPSSSSRSPITSDGHVEVRQSLALGGLGAAWGASCFTYSDAELERMGLDPGDFPRLYAEVASEIGVSGSPDDDCYRFCFAAATNLQPPVALDRNASSTMEAYEKRRRELNVAGCYLGRSYLAVLTEDLGERRANPYFDMDFYHDHGSSVYRPALTIQQLTRHDNFTYSANLLVRRFTESPDGATVKVFCHNIVSGATETYEASRLLLCAGAINSARISFQSRDLSACETTFLSSPGAFFPCSNLAMLGRKPDSRRLSLAQISGVFVPPDDPADVVSFQINHYSSLMLFKLVKEMPLPPWAGLLVARLIVSSLSVVGVYHADSPSRGSSLRLSRANAGESAAVEVRHTPHPETERIRRLRERRLLSLLRKLRYVPLGAVRPKWGTSMHYAGTMPIAASASPDKLSTDRSYRLHGARSVFVGDSSTWNYLPAKGLTFTIMANARKAAENVIGTLG